jgi:hypothetical protein
MKKIFAALLIASFTLGFATTSFAATHQQDNSLNDVYFGH